MDYRIVCLVYSASAIAMMKYDRCVMGVGATGGATDGATGGAGATVCVAKPGSQRLISPLREVRR